MTSHLRQLRHIDDLKRTTVLQEASQMVGKGAKEDPELRFGRCPSSGICAETHLRGKGQDHQNDVKRFCSKTQY